MMFTTSKFTAICLLSTAFGGVAAEPKLLDFPIKHCTTTDGCIREDTRLTLDANWRWYYHPSNFQNCFDNGYTCTTDEECADCTLTGDVDYGAYGINVDDDEVELNFLAQNGGIGSRVYVVDSTDRYKTMDLRNQEITMDVDISALGCGLNGAVYFSEMSEDGGKAKGSQGPEFGTGYCDAQCPDDLHQVDGKVNFANKHQCCNEMDIWEANGISNALTPHTCQLRDGRDMVGPVDCEGSECGEGADRFESICDKNGCDLNPYRFGNTGFYGPSKTVDTTRKFTVTTRFFADNKGDLTEIRRTYFQEDPTTGQTVEIGTPPFKLGDKTYDSITDQMCLDLEEPSPAGFGSRSTFNKLGGLKEMGDSFARGMVLVLSVWDDVHSDMLWLDGTAEANGLPSDQYGAARGPCDGGLDRNSAAARAAKVKYSNIRYGDLFSTTTYGPFATAAPTPTVPAPTQRPVTPAPTQRPVTPAPTQRPVTPAPTQRPVTPAPTRPVTSAPTRRPVTPAPTPSSGEEECGFHLTASCWASGCTVQVAVDQWVANRVISVVLPSGARINNMWNAQLESQEGNMASVRLAAYDSDSFGFNQAGSAPPKVVCGSSSNPTTAPPTIAPTAAPEEPECGLHLKSSCWASGCTVQVAVDEWVPNRVVHVTLKHDAEITSIWNAEVIGDFGDYTMLRLASYPASDFGFNQRGSGASPYVSC